jgi:hypothetical protein
VTVRIVHRTVSSANPRDPAGSVSRGRASSDRCVARRAAEVLQKDVPAFSYEWFFGACGLDDWGEAFE